MQLRKHLEYIKFYLTRIAIKEKIKVAFSSAVGFRRKGDLSRGLGEQLVALRATSDRLWYSHNSPYSKIIHKFSMVLGLTEGWLFCVIH